MFSEKGSLKDISVIKLLLTFFEQALSGVLYFNNKEVQKVLYLSRGKLIWAMSDSDEDKLENILISRKLVDPGILNTFKSEVQVSESIGKLLVERGLITLEELIESSKAQLKKIILDILKWKEGHYQLIQNAPPEKLLLNLDLSITNFIIGYILEEVDISDIINEIGSIQIEFIKNPNEQKIARYNLSSKQMEFLNSFTGEHNLESILSRYSDAHHQSLLKIIYFFLMAGLLIKKEVGLPDSPVVDEEPKSDLIKKDISDTDLEFSRPDALASDFESEEPTTLGIDTDIEADSVKHDISDSDLEFARPDAFDSDFESEEPTIVGIDTNIDVDSVKHDISDSDLEFARPEFAKPDALASDFASEEPATSGIDTDIEVDSVKPDISESDLELVERDISDTGFESVKPDISESDLDSVEQDISVGDFESVEQDISESDFDSVEPEISESDVELVRRDISDTDVDSVEPYISGADVDSIEADVSDTDVDSVKVKRDTSDTDFDTVQRDISGTSFASYKFTDSDTERKLMDLFGSEAKAAKLKEKAISIESTPPPPPSPSPSTFPILEEKEKEKHREGKKIKMLSLILVILILVIGGIILLLLPVLKEGTPGVGVMKTTKKGEVKTVDVDEPKLVVQKEKSQEEKSVEKKTGKPEEIKIEKVGEKKVAEKKVEIKKKEDQSKLIPGKSPMAYFREGNLITAGNIWKQELRKSGMKFTILLEMDCLIESVMHAYERIEAKENFFILNRKVGARACFLVMYGKYYTQQAAEEGIKQIPQYFWQQQSPPRVVELSRYL